MPRAGDLKPRKPRPMPAQLNATRARALARRTATRNATREVREALGRAVLADVREVRSSIEDGRVRVTVQAARWHDVAAVAAVVQAVPDLVNLTVAGWVICAYRPITEEG